MNPPPSKPTFNPTLWWSTIVGICLIIALGTFVTMNYRKMRAWQLENPRPGVLKKLVDFQAVNRDGTTVAFNQLQGKIWVAAYQYTDCPGPCLGMAAIMKTLHDDHGQRPDFHLVSISLNPKKDTPEKMDAWVKARGVEAPNWWFLTGDEKEIREYMIRYFMLLGASENTDPEVVRQVGPIAHDTRLALVDDRGNLRGVYSVMNADYPEMAEAEIKRLRNDLNYLFSEKARKGTADPAVNETAEKP